MIHPHGETEVFMTPDDFLRSITPGMKQPDGNILFLIVSFFFNFNNLIDRQDLGWISLDVLIQRYDLLCFN